MLLKVAIAIGKLTISLTQSDKGLALGIKRVDAIDVIGNLNAISAYILNGRGANRAGNECQIF